MRNENNQILRAVLTTIVACLVVFGLAFYIFGAQGFWTPKTPIIVSTNTTKSGTIIIPISLDSTGSVATGSINCTREYMPVCGTDGQTYFNACIANTQGVVVENEGPCSADNSGNITTPTNTNTGSGACTMEYVPVCGIDGTTYSNTCMAADMTVAHPGECAPTNTGILFDSGSYHLYSNVGLGYSFAMPKYSYYSGAGSQGGASHTMAISTTASGIENFATATVQVWFYRKEPITPPSDQSIKTENGILYIKNNDTTGNTKVGKIIETVLQSAK